MGLGVGGVAGAINVWRGAGEIYFDSLTALVFLLLLGRWLQQAQQRRATEQLRLLFSVVASWARRVTPAGAVELVPLEALRPGDVVEVEAGERVPVDGSVLEGHSALDLSVLTGEARPLEVGPGAQAWAGAVNLGARLRVRARTTGADTRMGRLMAEIERGSRERSPVVLWADRIAGRFVVTVSLLALATFAFWSLRGSTDAVSHAVAVLIVACPCALALATPLGVVVAIGRAAREGILIRGGAALEALAARGGTLVLDKTGTCTEGRMRVVAWEGDEQAAALVAALERDDDHPVGRALASFADAAGLEVEGLRRLGTGGRVARVDGREVAAGALDAIEAHLGRALPEASVTVARLAERGLSPVVVAVQGKVVAVVGVGDRLRPEARATVARLQRLGWEVELLSGDHPRVVAEVGRELGLAPERVRGGVGPEQKRAHVRALRRTTRRPVVMVGDGVNDAAALAAATVGVAVHGGAEASLAAAHVYLGRPGLGPLLGLIGRARGALASIRLAVFLSLGYNVMAMGLAMAGWIGPLAAALLMPASSLTVTAVVLAQRADGERPR
ncbi:MAG: cation-translocating P-type ATPase [Planctomycetota bacterium]|nr:MAG: cation-translocating P-type ATPase [Planctomycetota bacterium]